MELNLECGKGRRRNTSSAFGWGEDFMKRLESTEWSRADGACDLIGLLLSFSCSVMSNSLWPHGLQHARLPCPSPSTGVCSNSCPLSQWYHPTISSSVAPFSSCPSSTYYVLGIGLIVIQSISTTTLGGTIISPFYWWETEADKGWESSTRQDLAEELWA